MRQIFTLLIMASLLTACSNPAERALMAQQQEAEDNNECLRLGFPQGSPQYGDCRLRLREMRLQERLASRPVYADPYFGPRVGFWYR